MSTFNMNNMNKLSRGWVYLITIILFTFTSCVNEADIETTDPNSSASFEAALADAKGMMTENPELAIDQLNKVIIDAEAANSIYYSGKAKWYKAYINDEIVGNVPEAYISYNEALKDLLQTDDSSLKLKIYNNLGVLYRYYEEYDAAIENYKAAILLEEDLGPNQLSNVYYNLGVALKLKGDEKSFLEAEQAFTTSLKFAREADNHDNIADINNQIGLMYKAMGDYEVARIAYNNTISTYVGNADLQEHVGRAYHGIGVTYMEEGNAAAAVRAFNKALEYKKRSSSIFVTKYDLGTILMRDGQLPKAIEIWKEALTEKHDRTNIEQVQIYSDLTAILKENEQFEEALGYSEIYQTNINKILAERESYKNSNDQVIFSNVINEYAEFNKSTPLFARPLFVVGVTLALIGLIYAIVFFYYRSRSRKKMNDMVSDLQSKFMDIKVE